MKKVDVEQGTHEWLMARLGKPTASRFDQIMTEAKRQYSKQAKSLRSRLLAEWMLGYPMDDVSNEWTTRGTTLESDAVAWYELQRDVEVQRVGFGMLDDESAGASPDGLIGNDGGLEIKCFSAPHHIDCLLGADPATKTQVQGNIWVFEREWWDVLAYNPALPPVLIRVPRDDKYIEDLSGCVRKFTVDLANAKRKIEGMGEMGRLEDSSLKKQLEATLAMYGAGTDPNDDAEPELPL